LYLVPFVLRVSLITNNIHANYDQAENQHVTIGIEMSRLCVFGSSAEREHAGPAVESGRIRSENRTRLGIITSQADNVGR
jgi:hypothetical protein